jgi:hypothetical protein
MHVACTIIRAWSPTVWSYTLSCDGRTHSGQIVCDHKPTAEDCLDHLRASVLGLKEIMGGKFSDYLKGLETAKA